MSTPTGNNKITAYVRKEEPGFLENLGVKYYRHLGKKFGTAGLRLRFRANRDDFL